MKRATMTMGRLMMERLMVARTVLMMRRIQKKSKTEMEKKISHRRMRKQMTTMKLSRRMTTQMTSGSIGVTEMEMMTKMSTKMAANKRKKMMKMATSLIENGFLE